MGVGASKGWQGTVKGPKGLLYAVPSEANKVLRFNPANVGALSQLASICRYREQFGDAVRHLDAIIELDPNNGEVYGAVGHCYLMQSQKSGELADVLDQLKRCYAAYQMSLSHLTDVCARPLAGAGDRGCGQRAAKLRRGWGG